MIITQDSRSPWSTIKCLLPVKLPVLTARDKPREPLLPCLDALRPVNKGSLYLIEGVPGFFKGVHTPTRTLFADAGGFCCRFFIVCFRSFFF